MNKLALAAAALALCSLSGAAQADDSLSSRAVTVLGIAIASQGDAALVQIRRELAQSAVEAMKPFRPETRKVSDQPQPAETAAAKR
jgi:hypothetical protein